MAEPLTILTAGPHQYGSIQVDLPRSLAERVRDLGRLIPDGDLAADGREDRPHITVWYGLTTADIDQIKRALSGVRTLHATLGQTEIFNTPDADVVYISVRSPELEALHAHLVDSLPGVETHLIYVPHVTVAYVKPGLGAKYAGYQGLSGRGTGFDRVVFSPPEHADDTIIPLGKSYEWTSRYADAVIAASSAHWQEGIEAMLEHLDEMDVDRVLSLFGSGADEVDRALAGFDPTQPRAEDGKWTEGGMSHGDAALTPFGTGEFFHGGTAEYRHLQQILKEGITGYSKKIYPEARPGLSYVTTDEKNAEGWAQDKADQISDEAAYRAVNNRERGSALQIPLAVLRVQIPKDEAAKLGYDQNFPMTSPEREFKGDIKPEWITGVKVSTTTYDPNASRTMTRGKWRILSPEEIAQYRANMAGDVVTLYVPLVFEPQPLKTAAGFDPSQARDDHGQWTDGGQARAKAGGEIGPNGEWYPGGAFIATTDMPKRERRKWEKLAGDGKETIEFGKRETVPVGKIPIWRQVGTFLNQQFEVNETALNYYAGTNEEFKTQLREAATRARAGERLFDIKEFPALAWVKDVARMVNAGEPIPGAALDAAEIMRPDLSDFFKQGLRAAKGNEHSGNYGHEGRPGLVGGSKPGSRQVIDKISDRIKKNVEAWREKTGLTREVLAGRIQALYDRATPEQLHAGAVWYPEARAEAVRLAETYGLTPQQGAGVIAALSPLREWSQNKADAERLLKSLMSGTADPEVAKLLQANVEKATAIAQGADPREVLWKGDGFKVRSFYSNINDPEGREATIDTHMLRVLLNDHSIQSRNYGAIAGNIGRYDAFRQAIFDVADKYHVSPASVQAVVWLVQKDEHPKRSEVGGRLKAAAADDQTMDILVDALDALFPEDTLKTAGGAGSGNFHHAGRPGEVGGSAPSNGTAALAAQAVALSRTSKGVSDTSSSKDKPGLAKEGQALIDRVENNTLAAAALASATDVHSPEQLQTFIENLNKTLNNGLTDKLYREHEITQYAATPVADIPRELKAFSQELFDRIESGTDPIETAAWVEWQHNKIHPFSDAVGRTTLLLSNWTLQRAGHELPTYGDRKAYYANASKDLATFTDYYRTLFKEPRALGGQGSGNFGHAGRPGEVGGSATALSADAQIVNRPFDLKEIKSRKFLYNPDTNTLVLGGEFEKRGREETHADVLEAVNLGDTPEKYDSYTLRGFLGTKLVDVGANYAADGRVFITTMPTGNAEDFDAQAKLAERLVKSGGANSYTYFGNYHDPAVRLGDSDFAYTLKYQRGAGGQGSGNFHHEGRPGEVGGSAPSGRTKLGQGGQAFTSRTLIDYSSMGTRKFMYDPRTGLSVFGSENRGRGWSSTHAEFFDYYHGAGHYDDYVRGFTDRNGAVINLYGFSGQRISSMSDEADDNNQLKTLEYFAKSGAPADAMVHLIQGRAGSPLQDSTLGELFPDLYSTRRKRAAAGFDPSEPRDDHGRWVGTGGGDYINTAHPLNDDDPEKWRKIGKVITKFVDQFGPDWLREFAKHTPQQLEAMYRAAAGFDPNQPRDEEGQWSSGGALGRPNPFEKTVRIPVPNKLNGRPEIAPDGAKTVAHKVSWDTFDISKMKRRRFAFRPSDNTLILGDADGHTVSTGDGNVAAEYTHADMIDAAAGYQVSPDEYDSYLLRGFLGTDAGAMQKSSKGFAASGRIQIYGKGLTALDQTQYDDATAKLIAKLKSYGHITSGTLLERSGSGEEFGKPITNTEFGYILNPRRKRAAGSATSGNYGHAGRPGQVGGSAPGIPDELEPYLASTIEAMKDARNWTLRPITKLGRDSKEFEIVPLVVPDGIKTVDTQDSGVSLGERSYDPELAKVVERDGLQNVVDPKLEDGWSTNIPAERQDGVLYRGMTAHEWEEIQRTGQVSSRGAHNLGDEQVGLTYFSTDPEQAAHYAAGFQPWQFQPTWGRPAVVIAIKDPGTAKRVEGTGPDERGIPGVISKDDILSVYEGRPYALKNGYIEMYQKYGRKYDEGSRGSPSVWTVWKQKTPELRASGGQGSGNFGHSGRPGEVGGSAPGDSMDHPAVKTFLAKHPAYEKELREYAAAHGVKKMQNEVQAHLDNQAGGVGLPSYDFQVDVLEKSLKRQRVEIKAKKKAEGAANKPIIAQKVREKYGLEEGDKVFDRESGQPGVVKFDAKGQPYIHTRDYGNALIGSRWQKAPKTAGGHGSGNFGHAGRPGEIGGSAPGIADASALDDWIQEHAPDATITPDILAQAGVTNIDTITSYDKSETVFAGTAGTDRVIVEEDGTVRDARDWVDSQWNPERFYPPEDPNAEFWSSPPDVYHGTSEENAARIEREGIEPRNETRGITNRSVGSSVFTSINPESLDQHYDVVFKIDTEAMKRDGVMPEIQSEPAADEAKYTEALAHKVGIEDYSSDYGGDPAAADPDTVIFNGAIPAKYLLRMNAGFDPSEARDDHGRWTDDGGGLSGVAAALAQADGGFTYSPVSGRSPTEGYALSLHKDREQILDAFEATVVKLAEYAMKNRDLLADPHNYMGGWHNPEDGKVYLDVSTVVDTAEEAEKLAREADQLAYYDLQAGKSIQTRRAS